MLLITNDVDEAILLADRIIPLSAGPAATLGPEVKVELARPRDRGAAGPGSRLPGGPQRGAGLPAGPGQPPGTRQGPAEAAASTTPGRRHRRDGGSGMTNIEKKLRKRLVALKGDRRDPGDRPLPATRRPTPATWSSPSCTRASRAPTPTSRWWRTSTSPSARGEFVSLIGHSGCGKSTVLSIVAGLANATLGGVVLDGREVTEPGPDRGVVFQSPCLLPWMTAAENVMLGVSQVFGSLTRAKKHELVAHYLGLVGLGDALHKKPAELSAGMRQRVGIARAFALQPKLLLLDEPFGMLDSLTRFELQQVLLELWGRDRKTALMVTHDVDEALFLSDRVAMMTSGPRARLGGVLEIPFARPRDRAAIMNDPLYYELREQLIGFLNSQEHEKAPADDDAAPAPERPAQGVESAARKSA